MAFLLGLNQLETKAKMYIQAEIRRNVLAADTSPSQDSGIFFVNSDAYECSTSCMMMVVMPSIFWIVAFALNLLPFLIRSLGPW